MIISIIIPCYNVGKFLSETLESILAQTFRDFEVICVNDGSTDNTYEVIEYYCKKDSRIQYIMQPNSGVSSARNSGLSKAYGDFICFIDGDDTVEPDFLERFVCQIGKYPNATQFICDFSRNMRQTSLRRNESFSFNQTEFIKNVIYNKEFNPQLPCMLFRHDIIRNHNLLFEIGCARGEDREFYMKYALYVDEIIYMKDALYHYRINEASAMSNLTIKSLTSISAAIRTYEYYKKQNVALANYVETYIYYTIWKLCISSCTRNQISIFNEIQKKYDVATTMQFLKRYPRFIVRISACIYLLSSNLFKVLFKSIGILKKY